MSADRQTDGQAALRRLDATESVRIATGPMLLDSGRFNAADARGSLLLILAVVAVACLGALLAAAAAPRGTWAGLSTWRWLIVGFGVLVALLALMVAVVALTVTLAEWLSYRRRLEDWHAATLAAYEDAGGQEIDRSLSVFELSDAAPAHLLLLALSIQQQLAASSESKPWSVREIEGDVWLRGSRGNLVKLGNVSAGTAERMGRRLAELGLVEGRKNRSAGRWVAASADEVLAMVADGWSRRGQ